LGGVVAEKILKTPMPFRISSKFKTPITKPTRRD